MTDHLTNLTISTLPGPSLTPSILSTAANLFTTHYGIWAPLSPTGTPGARIRTTPARLRAQHLPTAHLNDCVYIRAVLDGMIIGHVFACYWECDIAGRRRNMCWVTQMVVDERFRSRGVAERMLAALREEREAEVVGVLSSHAHALMAVVGGFAGGLDGVDLQFMREHAARVMVASPVEYVREAGLHGSLFEESVDDASVSSADTAFFVDHAEPARALAMVRDRGVGAEGGVRVFGAC